MVKVIGAKVSNDLYERIASIGPISDIVKQSVNEYLERHSYNDNRVVNSTVNRECFDCKYKDLCHTIDRHLGGLNDNKD